MKLTYEESGKGVPLIILHGLFGSSRNWRSMAKKLSEHYHVICVNLRNHGDSPHTDIMTYSSMSTDITTLMTHLNITKAHIIGHSMGGKVAIQLSQTAPDTIKSLICVDIAPKNYPKTHNVIIEGLLSMPLQTIKTRHDADSHLKSYIKNTQIRQFLLTNLNQNSNKEWEWKLNIHAIANHYTEIIKQPALIHPVYAPTLFIKGAESNALTENDRPIIKQFYPHADIKTIQNAGHWVHSEQPLEFYKLVIQFLQKTK